MKTWEIYQEKYKTQRFKKTQGLPNVYYMFDNQGVLQCYEPSGKTSCRAVPRISDDWEIINEPVDFIEAIAALHREGKTIYCYLPGGNRSKIIYSTKSLKDEYTGTAITTNEIMNGEWHVEE